MFRGACQERSLDAGGVQGRQGACQNAHDTIKRRPSKGKELVQHGSIADALKRTQSISIFKWDMGRARVFWGGIGFGSID